MSRNTHAIEIALTEFTARFLWRYLRPFVRRYLSRRCCRCILSECYSPLDESGRCAVCAEYFKVVVPRDQENKSAHEIEHRLDQLLREYMGKASGPYDAVLLLSGGKDSAYLLHRMVTTYPDLRLICVLVDNGFMSPYALQNVARILSHFDVPHVTIKPKPSFVRKVFRHTLTHLDLQQGYSIVDLMDGHITFDHAKHFAVSYGIPLILCGLAKVQAEMVFGPTEIEFPPEQEQARLEERCGIRLRDVFDEAEMQFWFDGSQWTSDQVPRFVLPFTVWDPDEEVILSEVDRLGLISKKRSRPLVTNNALIPVIGMAEMARFGYCCWEVEFARMVREGKSERYYWLALFEMLEFSVKSGKFINKTVVETLAQLGLTKRDIGIGS